MDARIGNVPTTAAIPRDAVRPVRRREHGEPEHDFEDELAHLTGEEPRRPEASAGEAAPARSAGVDSDGDVGTQLDVLG